MKGNIDTISFIQLVLPMVVVHVIGIFILEELNNIGVSLKVLILFASLLSLIVLTFVVVLLNDLKRKVELNK